jgi:CheY-like chemotaxis protein
MEAIGHLAGGVAHDFNNILAALLLQVDLLKMMEQLPDSIADGLKLIDADVKRAANLVRQLLLFSRRQVMQQRNLDLNEVVTNFSKMLQRIIGEDIQMQLNLHPAPLHLRADRGMIEQVLLNFAANARDAMPKGGRLLVKTSAAAVDVSDARRFNAEAAPGRYVCLSVSDTGTGIPPKVMPNIFEPFFTTKDVGKGTGLGLATVFGIAKQHKGWVDVDNRPGEGVTFLAYFPALTAATTEPALAAPLPKPTGGTETILLVEDETAVREATHMLLERSGYHVLTATNGREALALSQKHRESVALLLTDLVMPEGVNGLELARQLKSEQPKLKIVFISGYSADVAGDEFDLHEGVNFLKKPFSAGHLLQTIRQSLDG